MTTIDELFGKAQSFLDVLPGFITVKDQNLKYVGVNSAFAALFEKIPNDILGKSDLDLMTPSQTLESSLSLERKILDTKEAYLVKELMHPKDSKAFPILSKKSVVIEEAGHYLVSFSLIEEDLLKEFSNVKSLHNLSILDQLAEVFVCWKDEASVFRGCNQNFADLVGKTKDEIIGVKDAFNPKHVEDDTEVRKTAQSKIQYEETIPCPDGNQIKIRTNKGVWKDADGNIIGTIATFNKTS